MRRNNVKIVEEYAYRIWQKADFTAIDELVHDEVVIHSLLGDFHGPDALRSVVQAWYDGFPGMTIKNISTIAENDLVVTRWQATGKHLGEFKGFKPTGNSVFYGGVTIYRIHEDKIIDYWAYIDMQHLLNQLT